MAELSAAETTGSSCCAPEAQATCCEPSAKADCCGDGHGEGCGCESLAPSRQRPSAPLTLGP
jgi:arsenite methyltransferase